MLAIVFALSFVVFGVGAGGTGIGDILRGGASSTGQSVEELQKKVAANPRDAAALKALANALIADNRSDEAAPVLERYSRLRPKDTDTLETLAAVYDGKAGLLRSRAAAAQARVQAAAPESEILPASTTPLGQALGNLPISGAVSRAAQAEFNDALGKMQAAYRQEQQVYERVVVLSPNDAAAQRSLGDAALSAGDNTTAIAAYKRFLELAPDDPEAPTVKQLVKQLQQSATATTPTSTAVGGSSSG